MNWQYFSPVILAWLLFLSAIDVEGPRRPKRIIGGDELLEKDRSVSPIKALDYYVWIGHSWSCYEDTFFWNTPTYERLCPPEDPDRLNCGGSLIHPRIVQTACHCLAIFWTADGVVPLWSSFKIIATWEYSMLVYMGKTEVQYFVYPIRTYRFAVHEKCGKLNRPPVFGRFDIGWVILEEDVLESKGVSLGVWAKLDYAGPYNIDNLNEFHHRVIAQRRACLVCGYGATELGVKTASKTFKFGWMVVYDFENCYDQIWRAGGLDRFGVYSESLSWACLYPLQPWNPSLPIPTLGAQYYSGDSGSPITCDNNYFAVVSSRVLTKPKSGRLNVSVSITVQSVPEANTIQHRRDFERRVLLNRYNPDNLRVLILPNGSIHFQPLKYSEKKVSNKPATNLDHVVRVSSIGILMILLGSCICLFHTIV